MKISPTVITCICLSLGGLSAQTALPYACSFNNTVALTGWTQYRNSSSSYNWAINPMGYSSSCLSHYYPVSSSAPTEDWYVSPGFNFSAGGKIDSLRMQFSGFSTPGTNDTIAIYLLSGSPNPTLASARFMLYDFRGSNYQNDTVWRKLSPLTIPALAGTSYLAFKYSTTNSWLDVKCDNLRLSGNSSANIDKWQLNNRWTIRPSLADNYLCVHNSAELPDATVQLKLFDLTGQCVLEKQVTVNEKTEISLTDGVYFYQIINGGRMELKHGRIIVKNE